VVVQLVLVVVALELLEAWPLETVAAGLDDVVGLPLETAVGLDEVLGFALETVVVFPVAVVVRTVVRAVVRVEVVVARVEVVVAARVEVVVAREEVVVAARVLVPVEVRLLEEVEAGRVDMAPVLAPVLTPGQEGSTPMVALVPVRAK
jgi:hypothetical protein